MAYGIWRGPAGGNNPSASYAEAVAAVKPPTVSKFTALVRGVLVEWVRSDGGTALGGGWAPADIATPSHFGAVGDGVADDTAAVQQALDLAGVIKGRAGDVHRITSPLVVRSNSYIDLSGAKLLRDFTNDFVVQNEFAFGGGTNDNITLNLWIEDGGPTGLRGNGLLMSNVDGLTVDGLKVRASSPQDAEGSGAWSAYISGENIRIRNVDIINPDTGITGDGLHFGYVKGLTLTDYRIESGDDALAFHFPPTSFAWAGQRGVSSGISVGPGYVSSAHANGLRIGSWTGGDPSDLWTDITINGITFGPCGTSTINMDDRRTVAEIVGKNDNIQIYGVNLGRQGATGARILALSGNDNIANDANLNQKNFGKVIITAAAGTKQALQAIRAGGIDTLILDGFCAEIVGTGDTAPTSEFRQIDQLTLRGFDILTRSTGSDFTFTLCRDVLVDGGKFRSLGTAFAAFQISMTTLFNINFRMYGGRVEGHGRYLITFGTGSFGDFIVEGTDISTATVTPVKAATSRFVLRPAQSTQVTVANLPTGISNGTVVFASNARKAGEAVNAGTGCPVYYDDGTWRTFYDNSAVTN